MAIYNDRDAMDAVLENLIQTTFQYARDDAAVLAAVNDVIQVMNRITTALEQAQAKCKLLADECHWLESRTREARRAERND